jgi:D-arabinitol 4-dehydrogenase
MRKAVSSPPTDRRAMSTPPSSPLVMLHLGLGSFHRAHQAVYLQRLVDAGDATWSIVAGNTRPGMDDTIAALQAQRGAYTLETVSPAGERRYERITAIRDVVPYEPSLAGLVERGADARTRIVSFTVTEAGYYLDAHDKLDLDAPELGADLERARDGLPGGTLYGALAAILRQRRLRGSGPLTLLCCDNLRHNGDRTRAGLLQFIEAAGDAALLEWVHASTTCPNAMVDRITPRPTPDVAERVRAATGRADGAALMAESFIQWVIEDRFIAGRPAWESAGVQMVETVDPYEEAKIRLLNAAHAGIAWAGTLAGLEFIHEGMQDAAICRIAYDYATDDAIPVLQPSPIDLHAYRDVVLERFGNPAIRDTNQRVAMDGFAKIPGFVAPTIRERLASGATIAGAAMLPALFLAYLQRWHAGGLPHEYVDQAMDPAAGHAICTSADPTLAFCRDTSLWGPLAGEARLVDALRAAAARVDRFIEEHSA